MTSAQKLITDNIDVWTSAIKAKSRAGRGSSSKRELYGINKLRELILELAVRGKLVPQNSNDEPASVLLERIAAEKVKLIKEKKIKKTKPLPAITEDEKPFELPAGWEWARLGDLGDWGAGSTPKRGTAEFYGGNIPWFKSGELVGDYISKSEETVTDLALAKTSLRYNEIGDVLVAMYGATIGKTSILSVKATTNQAVCACTPFTGFINTFLLLLLKAYKSRLISMGAGGAQPNISREKIIATVIAVPPTNEEKRIVAKVDELMALCDQLEQETEANLTGHTQLVETLLTALLQSSETQDFNTSWQRIAQHFDTLFTTAESIDILKQHILQLAVMGKLVPQNPNDEPASKLLERIANEKTALIKAGKIKKQKPLPAITEDEKPFPLPNGWEWCRLGTTTNLISGQHLKPNEYSEMALDNGIPYITGPAEFGLEYPTFSKYTLETRALAKNGYILITCKGAGLGKLNRANQTIAISRQLMAIQKIGVNENFLFILLDSQYMYFQNKGVGIAIPGISREDVTDLVFMLPPLEEQQRIVTKVNQMMSLCDQLKQQLKAAQQTQLHFADAMVEGALN